MLKIPEVLGVAEARNELAHVLEDVEKGRAFIIKGPKGREALVISTDVFRRLQDAYLEVVGELETARILQDEAAVRAVRWSSEEDRGEHFTLSEVESLVGEEVDDVGEEGSKTQASRKPSGCREPAETPEEHPASGVEEDGDHRSRARERRLPATEAAFGVAGHP